MTENEEVETVSPEMPKQTPYERAQAIYNGIRKLKDKIEDVDLKRECGEIEFISEMLVQDLAPTMPRTIQDAYTWGMRGVKENTYLALLDAQGALLRTIRVSDNLLKAVEGEIQQRKVDTTLTQNVIVLGDVERPVPRSATQYIAFVVEGKGSKRAYREIPVEIEGLEKEEEEKEE